MVGNTPTCVGKTSCALPFSGRAWKHPHVRGEDVLASTLNRAIPETPPRAWGRPFVAHAIPTKDGNTPTCVGKTLTYGSMEHLQQKHPHVRGEDNQPSYFVRQPKETPPRAWGRLGGWTMHVARIGNTPTCVGKT